MRSKSENSITANISKTYKQILGGVEYSNSSLKDKLSGISNDYYKNRFGLYMANPVNRGSIGIGLSQEFRQNTDENGWYAKGAYNKKSKSGIIPKADLLYEKHHNRNNYMYDLSIENRKIFSNYGKNAFIAGYRELGRDYYINRDLTRETRLNVHRYLRNNVSLILPGKWTLSHHLSYQGNMERLNYDESTGGGQRDKNHFHLENTVNVVKSIGVIRLRSQLHLTQEQNQYKTSREFYSTPADYSLIRKDILNVLSYPFQSNDSLTFSYHV
ncbi:hypothetical protein KAJ27_09880 [bacterium]|nr:hypothetical protein [bacterium]